MSAITLNHRIESLFGLPLKHIFLSIAAHLVLVLALQFGANLDLTKEKDDEVYVPIELVDYVAPAESNTNIVPEAPDTVTTGDTVQDSLSQGLSSLLGNSKLKKKKKVRIAKKRIDGSKRLLGQVNAKRSLRVSGVSKNIKVNQKIKWKKLSAELKLDNVKPIDRQAIVRMLSAHHEEFQVCYERALLVDSKLKGKVEFAFLFNKSGKKRDKIHFNGNGGNTSKGMLKRCLHSVSQRLSFPKSIKNQTLKFNLLFRS